jgi:hypothetical protein
MTTISAMDHHDRGGHGSGGDDVGVDRAERFAAEHPGIVRIARVGWIAKGVVYGLTGLLAFIIGVDAWGGASSEGSEQGGSEASQTGAVAKIAEQPFGTALLWVVAIGLIMYSLWRLGSVLLPADNDAKAWLTRLGYLVSAIVYAVLAWTAIAFARHSGSADAGGEDSRVESFTTDLMDNTAGRAAVFAIGAVLIVMAAVFLYKAVTAEFRKDLMPGSVGPVSERALIAIGRVGFLGRSAMMGLIGFFLARAAVRFDPDDAQGLDGSLRKVADSDVGVFLVIGTGVGLVMYGVFCVISAPKQKLVRADS